MHLVILTWCLDYCYLKNQFIYERNVLVPFRAGHEEIVQNKSNEISKFSLLSTKTNSSKICFTFYCQYWLILCTYAVYEYYRDAFPSFISHVTIVIKHKLKEPFRKNYSVTFEEIQNKIKPLSQASGISLSC